MENASKALLIAAGVLIAILLLTLFSYLVRKMGVSTSGIYSTLGQHEISEYNQKFLNFEDKEILIAQDVATLINLASDSKNNLKYSNEVKIMYGSTNLAENQNYIDFIKKNSEKMYKCKYVNINPDTLLVDEVIIEDFKN